MTQILLRTNLLVLLFASVATAQLPEGFFTDVKRVPGVNSSSLEWSVTISQDNKTLYFGSDRLGGEGDRDLYQATRASVNDDWGNVVNLGTGINTSSYEANPTITEDGKTLYFTSDRDSGEGSFDIYVATRTSTTEEFGNVQNLGTAINSQFDDGGQTLPTGELSIFYNVRNRDGGFGGYDLYTATRSSDTVSFEPSMNLGPGVNTDFDEFVPFVTLDGDSLLFSDYIEAPFRPGGQGLSDIWLASRMADGTFGNVVNIGAPVNTSAIEIHPALSPDWPNAGSTLYFLSNQPGTAGGADIWQATWVPEPSSGGLAILGILGMMLARRRR